MKQKTYINILIVIGASLLLLVLWFNGLDYVYAQMLRLGANIALVFTGDTNIGLRMTDGSPEFIVKTLLDGRKGSYPQKADLILLPFIMILTWQVLMFFNLPFRQARRSAIENIAAFYVFQLIFLLLLTSYYSSGTAKFIYDLLMDSFYIIALFLIVKDSFRYELFTFTKRGGR
jgi:hypothetical protein